MVKNFFGDLDLWLSGDLDLWHWRVAAMGLRRLCGGGSVLEKNKWRGGSGEPVTDSGSWLYGSLAIWISGSLAPGYMDLYQAEHKSAADAAADAAADGFADAADDAWRLAAALSLEVGSPQVGDVVLGS